MKKAFFKITTILLTSALGFSQTIKNIDYIAPFSDDVAAIKKDSQWAFINKQGDIVVNFRSDLAITKTSKSNYPIFSNSRCLISTKKKGITYYGYIDKTGKTVIAPQFLNATPFSNDVAIVLELIKENIGRNELLGKSIVYYKYLEVTIDTSGIKKDYLTQEGTYVALDKDFLPTPPAITTQLISNNLYTILGKNKKWIIKRIDEQGYQEKNNASTSLNSKI